MQHIQLVLISDKGRKIIKTLRLTPERADFYITAIGQTFDIISMRKKVYEVHYIWIFPEKIA
jgi:hypothetical protein